MKKNSNGLTSVMPDEVTAEVAEDISTEASEGTTEPVVEETKKKTTTKEVTVTAELLNVRAAAKDGADILCVVPKGTKLTAKTGKVNSKWFAVTTSDGKSGFVVSSFVK